MARQFTRPPPGNKYTAAERAAWGAEQDRLRALRNAPGYVKPTPAKRASRAKPIIADTSGSSCFNSLTYKDGTVTASFVGPSAGIWEYDMSRKEAKEWFDDPSLGSYFNSEIR